MLTIQCQATLIFINASGKTGAKLGLKQATRQQTVNRELRLSRVVNRVDFSLPR